MMGAAKGLPISLLKSDGSRAVAGDFDIRRAIEFRISGDRSGLF
jgi:hypothetical protein